MKTLLHIFLLLIPIIGFPQGTPQGISYQAVAYDSEGFEISNQDISVRLRILLEGVDAEASYTEVHSVTTDDFGLFSLVISLGETSDTFSSINWEQGAYLKVEVDVNLDGEYSVMGVNSFNAVPYALYAPTDYRVDSMILDMQNQIDIILSGCTDANACNYNNLYVYDDESCEYPESGFDCFGNLTAIIGDIIQGGYLFYIDDSGQHGMVAVINDIGSYSSGCDALGGFNTASQIGSGLMNTLQIVDLNCNTNSDSSITAAQATFDYESNGYDDWYLPSIDELSEIYSTIGPGGFLNNIGGFSYQTYISSTATNYVHVLEFQNGGGWNGYNQGSKLTVRPIRSF